MFKGFLFLIMSICICSMAQATRTVKISIPKGQPLQLTNPSSVTVNYDLECFDAGGAQIASDTGLTLPANGSFEAGGTGGTCAAGATPVAFSTNSLGLTKCSQASTTFSLASGRCGAFSRLCTLDEVKQAESEFGPITSDGFWFEINSASWEFSTVGNSAYTVVSQPSDQAATSSVFNDHCRVGATIRSRCAKHAATDPLTGALCCLGGSSGLCKVTVNTVNGFLASPQFKGGAPF